MCAPTGRLTTTITLPYTAGEIVIGNMWAGTATQLLNSGTPCNYVYPDEGTVGYVDMWCIIKDTKNYDLACKWLDFMTGEDFQYNFATVEGNAHNTVNNKVYSKLTDEQKALVWALEVPSRVYMQPVLTAEQQTAWLDVWNAVKAAENDFDRIRACCKALAARPLHKEGSDSMKNKETKSSFRIGSLWAGPSSLLLLCLSIIPLSMLLVFSFMDGNMMGNGFPGWTVQNFVKMFSTNIFSKLMGKSLASAARHGAVHHYQLSDGVGMAKVASPGHRNTL